jgi:hypothetical protein
MTRKMDRQEYEKLDQADADNEHLADSNAESEDEADPRTPGEVRRHDEETLTAEEEAERLLTGGADRGASRGGRGGRRRDGNDGTFNEKRHTKRRKRRAARGGEEGELMYEMEEGGPRSSSAESSGNSSEVDMATLGQAQARHKVGTYTIQSFDLSYGLLHDPP